MEHILIAYYSYSLNAHKLSGIIQSQVGGTLFQIQPKVDYPSSYNTVVQQAKGEIQAGFLPELKKNIGEIKSYDTIFVGPPNWCSTIAPPVASFLSEHDFSGKTIVPFCTHGGGGQGRIFTDIAKLCPKASILKGFEVYGSSVGNSNKKVSEWLQKIGL